MLGCLLRILLYVVGEAEFSEFGGVVVDVVVFGGVTWQRHDE